MMWLDKPYYGPERRGTNSNEVKNQGQWAPFARATKKVIFKPTTKVHYPGYFEGADHDGALGCRLIANALVKQNN
jgi:hypothetical protein